LKYPPECVMPALHSKEYSVRPTLTENTSKEQQLTLILLSRFNIYAKITLHLMIRRG